MSKENTFSTFFKKAEKQDAYWVERAVLAFTEELVAHMERENISRAELARRLGTEPPYITKILRGTTNFTLNSMVRIAHAVGCEMQTHLQPEGAQTQWFDLLDAPTSSHAALKSRADLAEINKAYAVPNSMYHEETSDDPITSAA